MKFNLDPSFVGLDEIKRKHRSQITEFEGWAAAGQWEMFHHSHYDWWVFPINRKSSYGLGWTVYEGEIIELKKDEAFVQCYQRGVQLVAASWGWDVQKMSYIPNPKPEQRWQHWSVRLYKAALSVQLFGYNDYFESLKLYALDLIQQGESMSYSGFDLSWLFTTGIDPYP